MFSPRKIIVRKLAFHSEVTRKINLDKIKWVHTEIHLCTKLVFYAFFQFCVKISTSNFKLYALHL